MKRLKLKRLSPEERAKLCAQGWPQEILPARARDWPKGVPCYVTRWSYARSLQPEPRRVLLREMLDMTKCPNFWSKRTSLAVRARIINRALARIGYRVNNPECEP